MPTIAGKAVPFECRPEGYGAGPLVDLGAVWVGPVQGPYSSLPRVLCQLFCLECCGYYGTIREFPGPYIALTGCGNELVDLYGLHPNLCQSPPPPFPFLPREDGFGKSNSTTYS